MRRPSYPSDLSDEQWALLEPLLPAPAATGRRWAHGCREIVNTILYQSPAASGVTCLMTRRLAPRSMTGSPAGGQMAPGTRPSTSCGPRFGYGRDAPRIPSGAVLDSQSVPNAGPANEVGYDAGKGVRGRKRHVLVDLLGLLIAVAVTLRLS